MATTNIKLNFQNEEEGNTMRIVGLCTILFSFIPALIVYLALPEKLSAESRQVIAAIINFNIVGFLIIFLCGSFLSFIPLINLFGWLISVVVFLYYVIMNIKIAMQITNNQEVTIPIIMEIIK